MNPAVLIGMFMGVMLAFVFCAMTIKGPSAGLLMGWSRKSGGSSPRNREF
ncbi:MAG: hypothetical protein CM1200mP2_07550 [Planctomycetaceae bacterium]|nr:MAG: hypothetical protein CM1200mP2_07550 [Planctomycetaceae bacterium]